MKQQLIVIEGPTASGKTALGAGLATYWNTVVISADSRQFYKELSIGTAKPTAEEMRGIPHYFVDSHSIHDSVTAGRFEQEAMALIQEKLRDYEKILVVGGSGMFIDALCIGLDPIPANPEIQQQLRKEHEQNGLVALCEELQTCDPDYFEQVDRSNPSRVLRAIEVFRFTGIPFSTWRQHKPEPRPFDVKRFLIQHPREQLYSRIDQRVDTMIANGLSEEAKAVYPFRQLAPLQTVGYKECFEYIEGKTDFETCINTIKQHTRNYAKRQLTWFKRHPETIPVPFSDIDTMIRQINNQL